ncbi:CPBP family intramembrane glutamic endopeptidase [Chloroflexota bacterium]
MQRVIKQSTRIGISRLVAFYLLAFVISGLLWSPLIVWPEAAEGLGFLVITGAFGPAIAALLTIRFYEGPGSLRRWISRAFNWRINILWYLMGGLLLPLAIASIHLIVYQALYGMPALASQPPWYYAAVFFPLNVLITAPISSGMEEIGWQGVALPGLLKRFPPLLANVFHGLLWTTWHIPLFFTTAWTGEEPLALMFAYTIPLAMILTWLTNKSSGSVLPAILLHTATNAYGAYITSEMIFASPLVNHFTAIKTAIYWGIAILLIIATRGRLGLPTDQKSGRSISA